VDCSRRKLLLGIVGVVAAPAIVRASSIMPIKMLAEADNMTASEAVLRQAEYRQHLIAEFERNLETLRLKTIVREMTLRPEEIYFERRVA